jgi:hypothetical protein
MNKLNIKATLLTRGWEDVEQMIGEELADEKKFNTEGMRFEDIAVRTVAYDMARKIFKRVLLKLHRIKNEEEAKSISYK